MSQGRIARYEAILDQTDLFRVHGHVQNVVGTLIESIGPMTKIGEICRISGSDNQDILCEVIGFRSERVLLVPLSTLEGLAPGSVVMATGKPLTVGVGDGLLGRVLDGLGLPIDGLGALRTYEERSTLREPPLPLSRPRIDSVLSTGVRVIDAFLTLGKGQRIGLFAGSGVGKSTLLGMIAKESQADVNVIALVGERGREVNEFIERDLAMARDRTVVVVATSDQPAVVRAKAAYVATTIAEYFRDKGLSVNLMMDSVTRFAMALREMGLAVGEPPTARGYTPSVFAALPRLLERTGKNERGTITGIYTVLVDGDDMQEPIVDAVRGILDGHITLSRALAERGHYPAVDLLQSVSRLMTDLVDQEHRQAALEVRRWIGAGRDAEDLIRIGAYKRGTDPLIDQWMAMETAIKQFLVQDVEDHSVYDQARSLLLDLLKGGV
ncbi:FliI/YscN family ATPase [Ferroacidibacillus organovorans]|uniref:EscN/YscN/HrcN family type III secretion system ATPase n=1 Tax=Ferroacidibacillus organovorans TaxID=1765683 RepID=A0A162UYL6_9BACL|nr:FliI/YscN family ATPase [Ferroacidibacillus organovorans]KYP82154.1 EscN/YscN/HrcN family type III secretion system ATPase [Ferroacidibacillus organovorans]OAG94437.1 EscN/YscN/HrcN family type III secretion system ATPase [Ferroacidibacillus organovorans]OPG15678.1 hypothetical protein B2M26_11530 [Ferroacidibacillus organovorans]